MRAKQKIVHGRGPSNINLESLFAPFMFAGFHNHSRLLTMILHKLKVTPNLRRYSSEIIRTRAVFRETLTNYMSIERL